MPSGRVPTFGALFGCGVLGGFSLGVSGAGGGLVGESDIVGHAAKTGAKFPLMHSNRLEKSALFFMLAFKAASSQWTRATSDCMTVIRRYAAGSPRRVRSAINS
jgi:hypothetical protein